MTERLRIKLIERTDGSSQPDQPNLKQIKIDKQKY